jgi:DNA-binding beta-propeller fold protein YncE
MNGRPIAHPAAGPHRGAHLQEEIAMRNARWLALPIALACSGAGPLDAQVPGLAGTIVVTNKSLNTVTIADVGSGRTIATLPTGRNPHEIALSSDGRTAVVTNYGAQPGQGGLTYIDVASTKVDSAKLILPFSRPHGIVLLPGDSLAAVTLEGNRLVVLLHVPTGAVRAEIRTQADGSHMVGVTGNAALAYTGNIGDNTVSELDLRTKLLVRSWQVPAQPEAINVTADGSEVWVGSNATGRVSVLVPATGEVTTAAEGFGWPYRVCFTPDHSTVLLPDLRNEELRFLDRSTKQELGRIAFPGGGPQGITITPDGRYAFLSLSRQARVAIIDIAARNVVGHLDVGRTPDGVVYTTRVIPFAGLDTAAIGRD